MSSFPTFLSPIKVGAHTLKNRAVMGSMHTRLEHLDEPLRRQIAFYEARAKGGVGMVVTGGFSPNAAGIMEPGGPEFTRDEQIAEHKQMVDAVHRHGAKFLLQILHAGRYAKHDGIVGVSASRSPINPRTPRPLTDEEVEATLEDFIRCAQRAKAAGYDGVELMGSEGYLINQFMAERTNNRSDRWGGSLENRLRFPIELVKRTRAALGPEFLIMYRISAIDLVEGGSTAEEIDTLARAVEAAGADMINTGYGWHEAPVPTIAYQVPRAAWSFGAARLKRVVSIPVMASNRINTPEVAERLLARGEADLISMARPMLADPEFVVKAAAGRPDTINTCIACNQACLDYIFTERTATCLVNPRAGREIEFSDAKADRSKRIGVIGAGPAGMAVAIEAARRGHRVTLFEAAKDIGGQLHLARRIPGKTEFDELLRYFRVQLAALPVDVRTGAKVEAEACAREGFDSVVVAAGIVPRRPAIPGIDGSNVVGYLDAILGRETVGRRVAIIGAGGIAHDVAELLSGDAAVQSAEGFWREWGVDAKIAVAGGLLKPAPETPTREITLLQRSPAKKNRLGKSTGWIVRGKLLRRGVKVMSGVEYRRIDGKGVHVSIDGAERLIEADTVIVCAGQEPANELEAALRSRGIAVESIGGARFAGELDAARAIDEGTRLAQRL